MPALDPELDRPLDPIPPADPMPVDPVREADSAEPGELVADVPVDDPALSEPLPAIGAFDVATPESLPGAEETDAAPTVRYSVVVEGLDEVGLEDRFRDLSALEQADGEAATGAMIAARAEEDEALALRLLRSEGYYDATVSSLVEPVPEQPNHVVATITVSPDNRFSLGSIAIAGPETIPPNLAREALPLETGDPIVAAEVEAAEANVSLVLPQQGYPFVELGQRDILLDETDSTGDYTLPVQPGPRASFGGYSTSGDLAFDAEHVGVLARFKRGELFDSRKMDDLREALVATGLFSSVAVEPVRTGVTAPDGTEYVNLNVIQDAGPPRRIAGSAGYATGEGFKLQASWTHRNLFPPEGALTVEGVAGTQQQGLSVAFRRSNAGRRDRTVLLSASAAREDFEAYEAFTAQLSGRISRESTPIWQKRWTWAYGFELIATSENRFDETLGERIRETFFVAALPGQLGYDTSDNLLNPTSGFRITGRISPEISQQGGDNSQYVRGLIETSAYYPVSDSLVIAGRVRLGSIYGASRNAIAPSRRLYAGGGGSVRGFGYQELGPRVVEPNPDFDPTDPEEEDSPTISRPIGGRSLNEFALEARYRFGNFGIVPFVDVGQVYESQLPQFSDLRFGVGIGGRFYTNFGPLRIDVATPINRREGESKIAVYVSIGQAF